MTLIIGDKNFSSWSLRPWVLMKHFEIRFEEKQIRLYQPTTVDEIKKFSPSGKIPALIDNETTIWDSLAIAEYLHEKYPEKGLWPEYTRKRAWARSISCEMHSGFADLREHLSHNIKKQETNFDWSPAAKDIERIKKIWTDCLTVSKGPFLFGDFTIADAMYAPVVNRFVSYGVPTEGIIQKYVQDMRNLPAHREWIAAAMAEENK